MYRDLTVRGDGRFVVDIYVEDVLIAKGEGITLAIAEEDAMEDFVERLETILLHLTTVRKV